ncbi:neuroendocrine protein 7B2 precursor [Cooperia oncophora]
MMLALVSLLVTNVLAFDFGESAGDMALLPSGDFIDLISRDAENVPSPAAFGSKFITGGAGEGEQKLREEENFQQRQEVKSDNVLPAYCEPPNPCPVGYTAADGCLEEFENRYASGNFIYLMSVLNVRTCA